MEKRFEESQEFKKITFRVVKNERLADPYTLEEFPPDIYWVYERMQRGEGESPAVRPGWVVIWTGSALPRSTNQNWEEVHFRRLSGYLEHL
jgi:hypothetical protein